MKLFENLRKEMQILPKGEFAPYYFKYRGTQGNLDLSPVTRHAKGIYYLFSNTEPIIYTCDLIVGNRNGAYIDKSAHELEYAKKIVTAIGEREFLTNKDHYAPNYKKIISIGVTGLISEIEAYKANYATDLNKLEFLTAAELTLEGFLNRIENYINKAKELKVNKEYDSTRLDFIIKNCQALLCGPPQTFAQGLQLIWFCHTAFQLEERVAMALGRIDQYLYPLYKQDIENGSLTKERAIELLENTFIKIGRDTVNICIGGMNQQGDCEINDLSYCTLYAVKNLNIPGPNLSARITPNTPDDFLDEALKSLKTGLGYPALMNDEVNIAALKKYGYNDEDVYDYCMVGCIENFISGKQPPWSDSRFDTPRYLDYVFNNGISEFNESIGLDLGDVEKINSMNEFMANFEKQLKNGADEHMLFFNNTNSSINQNYYPEPFLSCFCDSCIEKGLDINNGGSKYPSSHGVCLMGVGTVCDSLAAIEKVVFIDKDATLKDIKNAINNNFNGYEELHRKLLDAPKYGNDDDFVDKYAVWFVDYLSSLFKKYKTYDGGGIYCAMAANTNNIYAGNTIAATPDGRKQGEPLSDAASPTYGKDLKGATSTLNSVSKPDYTKVACGTVINQKYSPNLFTDEKRAKIRALIKTFFKKGGQEIQMNVISRETLIDATNHPEKYENLIVRVSGFSEYYTRLQKEVQEDILKRTQQS